MPIVRKSKDESLSPALKPKPEPVRGERATTGTAERAPSAPRPTSPLSSQRSTSVSSTGSSAPSRAPSFTPSMGMSKPQEIPTTLQRLLDLNLQHQLPAEVSAELEELTRRSYERQRELSEREGAADGQAWSGLYQEAVAITERLVAAVTTEEETLQRSLLELDRDIQSQRGSATTETREIDQQIKRVTQDLNRSSKEWRDRYKRQGEHLYQEVLKASAQNLQLDVQETGGKRQVVASNAWWDLFHQYWLDSCRSWQQSATHKTETALRDTVHNGLRPLLTRLNAFQLPETIGAPMPQVSSRLELSALPKEDFKVTSTGKALGQYIRSNIMSFGILTTILGGLIIGGQSLLSEGGRSGGGGSMMIRSLMMVGVVPFLLLFGWFAVRRQKEEEETKAEEKERKQLETYLQRALKTEVDQQRDTLSRWLERVTQSWETAIQGWRDEVIEPFSQAQQQSADQAAEELKLKRKRLGEREFTLKSLRKSAKERILLDLKRELQRSRY